MSKWTWYIIIIIIAILLVLYVFNINANENKVIEYNEEVGGKFQITSSEITREKDDIFIKLNIASESSDTVNVIVNKLDATKDNITLREKKLLEIAQSVLEVTFVDTKYIDTGKVEYKGSDKTQLLNSLVCYSPDDKQSSILYILCNEDVNVEIVRNIKNVKIKIFK